MKRLYIADWHFGHKNVLHFDNRPFKTVEEMNVALVENWNRVVNPDDLVYVLGDMFWCKSSEAIPILKQLKGTKFLVKGNHDRCNDAAFAKQFAKINEYMEVDDEGQKIVLCHYPIPCYKNHLYGWAHLYGHVHTSFEWNITEHDQYLMQELYQEKSMMINVGAMMPYINYTPKTFNEIAMGYSAWKEATYGRNDFSVEQEADREVQTMDEGA